MPSFVSQRANGTTRPEWRPSTCREVRKSRASGAAQESNLPSLGLPDLTGFEDRLGHRAHAAPRESLAGGGHWPAPAPSCEDPRPMTATDTAALPSIDLPADELQARFDALQRRLVPQWKLIEAFTDEPRAVVVVPSVSGVDLPLDSTRQRAYEERFLFLLFLLRQPRSELVYVTSEPVAPHLIEYYLGLLPGVVASHARTRLHLVTTNDGGVHPLSAKLLDRPRLLDR